MRSWAKASLKSAIPGADFPAAASGIEEVSANGVEEDRAGSDGSNGNGGFLKDGGEFSFNERCTSLAKLRGPSSRVSRSPR